MIIEKVEVLAYDLGKPALSSTATVTVAVEHIVSDVPLDWQMNFSDMAYSVSVSEDALVNTLVKNISVVNKPTQVVPISCQIISGNENGKSLSINMASNENDLKCNTMLQYKYLFLLRFEINSAFKNQHLSKLYKA